MKSLFNEDEDFTREGANLLYQADNAIRTLFYNYVGKGYSIRDISTIIQIAIRNIEIEVIKDNKR